MDSRKNNIHFSTSVSVASVLQSHIILWLEMTVNPKEKTCLHNWLSGLVVLSSILPTAIGQVLVFFNLNIHPCIYYFVYSLNYGYGWKKNKSDL